MSNRFCEECGASLPPGTRFCEECGHPVPSGEAPASDVAIPPPPVTSGMPPVIPQGPEKILAVLPFASRQKGFIGTEDVSIVFTSRRVVTVVWTPRIRSELEQVRKQLEQQIHELERKGSDRITILSPLPFGAGTVFPPWEHLYPGLSELPGTALTDIEYIRGEQSDVAHFHEDLLVIGSTAGEQQFYVEAGWYTASAARLLPLVWEAISGGVRDEIVGIIPTGFEPEREGFGFAYPFTLVITTGRIILAFLNDSFADMQIAYLNRLMKETGKDRQQLGEMISARPPADAPWQGYLQKPLTEIFTEDPLNFFIPLPNVTAVVITAGKKNKGDLLVFRLPSHDEQLALDPGFGQLAYQLLSRVLGGRVIFQ